MVESPEGHPQWALLHSTRPCTQKRYHAILQGILLATSLRIVQTWGPWSVVTMLLPAVIGLGQVFWTDDLVPS